MSTTALAILNGAFDLIGEKDQFEVLESAVAIDGLRRLNNMVRIMETERLTIPVVKREVFPLVANQSTYTIGPGGQLETGRPVRLDGAGLLLNANPTSFAITAASVGNRTFTVAGDRTTSFPAGAPFEVTGSTLNDGTYTVVTSAYTSSTLITVQEPVASAAATFGTIYVSVPTSATGLEQPLAPMTDQSYQNTRTKQQTSLYPRAFYYNPTTPLGTIILWPAPTTAANSLVLYHATPLTTFATLTTPYDLPPGYEEMLEANLAKRLLTPYAVADQAVIAGTLNAARESLASIKRANTRITDLPNDAMRMIGGAGWYEHLFR